MDVNEASLKCSQSIVVRLVVRVSEIFGGSLHHSLKANVLNAFAKPSAGNWVTQVINP